MPELLQIFEALELRGWVCLMKWDGERDSNQKTVVVSYSDDDKLFRGDFRDFEQAGEALREWLKAQRVAWEE